MQDLIIENLSRNIQVDSGAGNSSGVSEKRILQDMQAHGMQVPAGGAQEAKSGGGGFLDMLNKSLEQVNDHQIHADQAIKELVSGRTKNIHETLLAVERADASLKLMMQVRNKVLDAYREIIRMQV